MPLSNEQAYVIGLLVGGGTIANSTFAIDMPFDKWGADPVNAAAISRDLLTKIRKIFSTAYSINTDYTLGNKGRWTLKPLGKPSIQAILDDLTALALPVSGNLLNTADLTSAKASLSGMRAEHFLTGIFDARASLTESHRRFNDSAPVVSIEVPGSTMNFKLVVQLCSWLTDLGSITDQILYNHPCQHATSDPTYSGWKKGFKIRFLVKSFIGSHSFAMKAKASAATTLEGRQQIDEQVACNQRQMTANTVSIHDDIASPELPVEVRSKIFLHYHHICAVMGCPHAPLSNVKALMPQALSHISVFPKLSKGEYAEMHDKHQVLAVTYFPTETIVETKIDCASVQTIFLSEDYPDIEIALAYLLSDQLNGKRHIGSKDVILAAKAKVGLTVRTITGQDQAPLFIGRSSSNRGVLLSSPTGRANKKALASKISITGININVR